MTRPSCVFLTMERPGDFFVYDELLVEPMAKAGWAVTTIPWTADVGWDDHDVAVVRSTWDYQDDLEAFLAVLDVIDGSSATLVNDLDLLRWNVDKTYLRDLAERGVPIVPTQWSEAFSRASTLDAFTRFSTDRLVVKPTVSANADDTHVVAREDLDAWLPRLEALFAARGHLLQPFVDAITDEGEQSTFVFGGELSHAVRKRPAAGDFRVQEEHGGSLEPVAADAELRALTEAVMAALPVDEPPLYARVDAVRHDGRLVVMEVELVEPSLYLSLDAKSPDRFVSAFVRRFGPGA